MLLKIGRISSLLLLGLLGSMLREGCPPSPQKPDPRLRPGEPFLGSRSERLHLALEAGEYLRLEARQEGIDVALRIGMSCGRFGTLVDSPTGTIGAEILHFVAPESGTYRLDVLTFGATGGRYELYLAQPHPASEPERCRFRAQETFFEARRRELDGRRRDALDLYRKALDLAQRGHDRERRAWTQRRLGGVLADLGKPVDARWHFAEAVRLFSALGDRRGEATNLNFLGDILLRLSESEAALEAFERARGIFHELGHRTGEASAINNLGNVHLHAGDPEQAIEAYRKALELEGEDGRPSDQILMLDNLGEALIELEQLPQAIDVLGRALELVQRHEVRGYEVLVRDSLARAYYRSGDPGAALEHLEMSLAIARQRELSRDLPLTLLRLGDTLLRLGRHDDARSSFEEALDLFRQAEDRRGEAAASASLGRLEGDAGHWSAAEPRLDRALTLYRDLGDVGGEASALYARARALYFAQRFLAAREAIRSAVDKVELLRFGSASLAFRSFYFASRQSYYDLYLDVLMDHAAGLPAGSPAERELTAVALEVGEQRRARGLLDALAFSAARIRSDARPELLEEKARLQRELNGVDNRLLEQNRSVVAPEILESLERRQRDLVARLREVQASIHRTSPRYASLSHPQPLSAEAIRKLVDSDTLLLVYSFGQERTFFWRVDSSGVRSFRLPKRADLEKVIRRLHTSWSRSTPSSWRRHHSGAREMGRILLGPVASELGHKRLVIVGEGVFAFLPFAALPDPRDGEPLVRRHEIIRIPSASVLALLRREAVRRQPPRATLAVLADPVFGGDDPRMRSLSAGVVLPDPGFEESSELAHAARDLDLERLERLPESRVEAESLLKLVPSAARFVALGFNANRETVLAGRLAGYRYLHMATHGLPNPEHPELSGIVLSRFNAQGDAVNGFLRVHEIYDLDLQAELVTLSACRTGLGRSLRGEGLIGLTQAFLYAGAERIAVSLWDVGDRATARLMTRFYGGLLKEDLSPASALRQAQLATMDAEPWSNVRDWAGFVIYGDW